MLADAVTDPLALRLLILAIVIVFVAIPAMITWMKGQEAAFFIGLFTIGLVWYAAACRLAKPTSWWAHRFYGPEKLQRAYQRFDGQMAER